MELNIVVPGDKASKDKVIVVDEVFAQDFNEPLVHQVVTSFLAGLREGTKAQKSRSDVRGGGRKPFRQKGTGRARAGTTRSPLWRSGGVTFAARPQDYSQKINKKMYRGAVRSIISELIRQERFVVVKDLKLASHKTKEFLKTMEALNVEHALIVDHEIDQNLFLAAKNVPHVNIRAVQDIDPVSLVHFDHIVVTVDALKKIEEWLK